MQNMNEINKGMGGMMVILGTGLLGAALALLLAPQSGRRSRRDIMHYGKAVTRKSDLAMRKIADNVIDFAWAVQKGARRAGL